YLPSTGTGRSGKSRCASFRPKPVSPTSKFTVSPIIESRMGGSDFSGFHDGPLQATVIPSIFFSDALSGIDDLGELKLILYLFWRLGRKKAYPRFVTRRELDA